MYSKFGGDVSEEEHSIKIKSVMAALRYGPLVVSVFWCGEMKIGPYTAPIAYRTGCNGDYRF